VELDPWDLVALLDLLANLEMMVKLANLANLASVDPLALRELVDSQGLLVYLASRDTEVTLVWTEPRERPELQEARERAVLLVRMAPLDPWDPVVCLVREDVLEHLELLVLVEMMVCPALLVPLAPLVLLELLVSPALQVPRVKLVPLEHVVLKAPRGPVESQAPQDLLDPPEHLETQELMALAEPRDLLVLQVLPVPQVSPAPVALPDLRERLDLWDQREHRVTPVSQVSRERLAPRERSDLLVFKDPWALQERRVREAPAESLVLLGPSDPLEREVPLVTVVSQDRMVWLVLREPLVSVVLPVLEVLREPVETLVVLESLACLVPEVLLVALVMLDLKAKLDPLVQLVRTVVLDPLGPREPEDSQESWASPDPRELPVRLVKVERKVFWELQV